VACESLLLRLSLKDYKATQKIAAEREASSLPREAPAPKQPQASTSAVPGASEVDIEAQQLLKEQQLQEARAVDNALAYNEALIEERDLGIAGVCLEVTFATVGALSGSNSHKAPTMFAALRGGDLLGGFGLHAKGELDIGGVRYISEACFADHA